MKDKQILIDGRACCCYENGKCLWTKRYYENNIVPDCEKVKNCYYKQLKRKEQGLEQLDQLKAENDKYSLLIEKLCDYAGLECDSEEQAMRALPVLASQMNKARLIIDRYKQTLAELKEIAEKEVNNRMLFADKESFCDFNKILEKIKEVIKDEE